MLKEMRHLTYIPGSINLYDKEGKKFTFFVLHEVSFCVCFGQLCRVYLKTLRPIFYRLLIPTENPDVVIVLL